MAKKLESERGLLDAVADLVSDMDGADSEELDGVLRAQGIEPSGLMDRILGRVKKQTWRVRAQREMASRKPVARQQRPAGMHRAAMMAELNRRSQAGRFFRNADELSDDDLWEILCDQRELEDGAEE